MADSFSFPSSYTSTTSPQAISVPHCYGTFIRLVQLRLSVESRIAPSPPPGKSVHRCRLLLTLCWWQGESRKHIMAGRPPPYPRGRPATGSPLTVAIPPTSKSSAGQHSASANRTPSSARYVIAQYPLCEVHTAHGLRVFPANKTNQTVAGYPVSLHTNFEY